MKKFTLSIEMNNASFQEMEREEVSRILADLILRFENSPAKKFALFDYCGNHVGIATFEERKR